ncbi:MAG: HEAT repeat domain-containing protein, partial [Myxococcales bacterium]|nr:HEAT repeat domain-containing protein [Myxococcales bacterium]
MSDTTYYTYRGDIRALTAAEGLLAFVTVHDEGQATAFYRINVDKRQMMFSTLPCGGEALIVTGDMHVYIAGSDRRVYHRAWAADDDFAALGDAFNAPIAGLAELADDRLAVVSGDTLAIVKRKGGKVLQRLALPEPATAVASDPSGKWIAVGCARGTLAVFDGEDKKEFAASEHRQVHQGAILSLLFEQEELRVLSGGTDAKIFLTHVRGALDPELRSGRSGHDEAVTCMVHGPGDRTYSGGRDKVIKIWARGQGRSSTLKGLDVVRGLTMFEHKARPHLAIACEDQSIRVYTVDAGGKIGERVHVIHGAAAWARNERARKEPKAREKAIRKIAAWNDAVAIDSLGWFAQNDGDHALKVLATELLGASGNPRAKGPLGDLLRASEEKVRLTALSGLRGIEGERSLGPLRLALGVRRRDVGVVAIQALAGLAKDDDIALDRLIEALGDDPSEVRIAALLALEALHAESSPQAELLGLRSSQADIRRMALVRFFQRGFLDRPEVLAVLRRHAADADAGVRKVAFNVSLLTKPKLAAALRYRDRQLHRALHEIESASAPSFELKIGASDAEADKARTKLLSALEARARGENEGKAAKLPKAKKVAASTVSEEDKRPLLEAMASRALDTCLAGASGLALLGDPRALGTLLQLSRERDGNVRVAVCKSLQALGDPRGAARLRLLIRDGEASVRDAAFSALTKLESSEPLAIAEAGLLAEHEDVRRRGLDLLVKQLRDDRKNGEADDPAAIALLERALGDAGRSVRSEAFKAVLNLEIDGGGAASLRFALRSLHADIRREVLGEVIGQIEQGWAWELLLELFSDPDAGVRSEAFEFAMKRTKGIGEEPLQAALSGPYPDLRLAATDILSKRKAPGVQELLAKAARDDDEKVRSLAIDALLVNDADDALVAAMASPHADVVVRAAAARATHGDPRALPALLGVLREEEPEIPALQAKWHNRIIAALKGLAELADPGARSTILPFLEHKDSSLRAAAIEALAGVARPDDAESLAALQAALQHADAAVRQGAALGLALCGDLSGASILFSGNNLGDDALLAALALSDRARDVFMSFLDHKRDRTRDKAMLLMLLQELAEGDGVPDRSLAALSAANPRVRLAAAQALENFADHDAFFAFVVRQVNDRGEGKAAWTIAPEVVALIAEAITFGDELSNPQFRARAARLLDALDPKEDKQEAFDRQWRIFTERFAATLTTIDARAKQRPQVASVYAPEELRALVFGAYAGLSRLSGGANEARIRQTAIARLVA